MRWRPFIVGASVTILVLVTFWSCRSIGSKAKQFSPRDVAEIREVLNELDPGSYRIVLPEFTAGEIVGSTTYGDLPVTEVRRLASLEDIEYRESGNLQAIFFQSCSGGGAGSHTPSRSRAGGRDVGRRIERILAHIDESAYIFIR